jgi:hypothetical protein
VLPDTLHSVKGMVPSSLGAFAKGALMRTLFVLIYDARCLNIAAGIVVAPAPARSPHSQRALLPALAKRDDLCTYAVTSFARSTGRI